MWRETGAAVLVTTMISGCATPQATHVASAEQLVLVSDIVGSLKCAFAKALELEHNSGNVPRLKGQVAVIQLELKVVHNTEAKADLKAKGPAVLVLGSGGTVTPKLTGSLNRTSTIKTTVKGRLGLDHVDDEACSKTPSTAQARYRFELWLSNLVENLDLNAQVAPFGVVDQLVLDADFAVTGKSGLGGEFDIVFFGGTAELSDTRQDIQHLVLTIQPEDDKVKYPRVKVSIDPQTGRRKVEPEKGGTGLLGVPPVGKEG